MTPRCKLAAVSGGGIAREVRLVVPGFLHKSKERSSPRVR